MIVLKNKLMSEILVGNMAFLLVNILFFIYNGKLYIENEKLLHKAKNYLKESENIIREDILDMETPPTKATEALYVIENLS